MKYVDGPATSAEISIAAPPERVWDLVTDIELPARFSSEFKGASWTAGDGPGLGHKFVGRNEHKDFGVWDTTSTVIEFEPERVFSWAVENPDDPAAVWAYRLEPEGEGTRLRYDTKLGPGVSGLSIVIITMPDKEERIIERRLGELTSNMEATLAGIKELAEASA